MTKYIIVVGVFFCTFVIVVSESGCNQKSPYQQEVDRELAKGVRHDTLFLGLFFGMRQDSFYKHCFYLNHQEMVKEGPMNMSVQYPLKGRDSLSHPAAMNFFPDFEGFYLSQLNVTFAYNDWAPWKAELNGDHLIQDVVALFERWYGPGFKKEGDPKKGVLYYQIVGNRQIVVTKKDDDIQVIAKMTDLSVKVKKKE